MAESKQVPPFKGYAERTIFYGNQRLNIATLNSKTEYANTIRGTGLVSVSDMQDSAEITNYPADDMIHATIQGASIVEGSITFIQLDRDVRIEFFGQDETANGYGTTSGGVFPDRIVQFCSTGKNQKTGQRMLRVVVYPNMKVTGKPSTETTTIGTDAPTAIQWTANVQATGTDLYTSKNGFAGAEFEYFFKGDEVDKVLAFIDAGGIILPDYDVNTTKAPGQG